MQRQNAAKAASQNGTMKKWKEVLIGAQLNLMPMSDRLTFAALEAKHESSNRPQKL